MALPRNNLNLLVILDALLTERNVTRAAKKVNLSQPAMSSAFARLRDWLGDPLLVKGKGKGGLVLTPRAEELIEPLRRIMADIEQTFAVARAFDPATAARTFRIAASDAFELITLPRLLERIAAIAPGIHVRLVPLGSDLPETALNTGDIDLACGHFPTVPAHLHTQVLYDDPIVCVVRRNHPTIKRTLTLRQYLQTPHILSTRSADTMQAGLAQYKQKIEVAMTVSHFLVAPLVVSRTNYILTVPRWLADAYAEVLPLKILKAPFARRAQMHAVWHDRTHHDAANRWLRDLIAQLCRSPT